MTATNKCYNFVGFRCSPPLYKLSILTTHINLRSFHQLVSSVVLFCGHKTRPIAAAIATAAPDSKSLFQGT